MWYLCLLHQTLVEIVSQIECDFLLVFSLFCRLDHMHGWIMRFMSMTRATLWQTYYASPPKLLVLMSFAPTLFLSPTKIFLSGWSLSMLSMRRAADVMHLHRGWIHIYIIYKLYSMILHTKFLRKPHRFARMSFISSLLLPLLSSSNHAPSETARLPHTALQGAYSRPLPQRPRGRLCEFLCEFDSPTQQVFQELGVPVWCLCAWRVETIIHFSRYPPVL